MRSASPFLIGLLLPLALVLGAILLVPAEAGRWLGISLRAWALFACAPLTSLLLYALAGKAGPGR